ncbi:hypothetical protein HMPREF0580_1940 [Mobiluncus mulieris ATCC 35239]|uniref:Uncharacterized protein n=1 Tax=Mobiluncus mulieris ATCC 35239 TaxID=871571 RepID=E0QSS5_9ACTO|nr:hypothetical protein HMPREF0580_1940 [Mobiluncus mulieris ATCC 35239]
MCTFGARFRVLSGGNMVLVANQILTTLPQQNTGAITTKP